MKAAIAKMNNKMEDQMARRAEINKKKAAAAAANQGGPKTFTRGQIASHKTVGDCWIILGGKVYDVSKFIMDHPGGSFTLLDCAGDGKDHMEDFEAEEHSKSAVN